jgi:hypothetical protein
MSTDDRLLRVGDPLPSVGTRMEPWRRRSGTGLGRNGVFWRRRGVTVVGRFLLIVHLTRHSSTASEQLSCISPVPAPAAPSTGIFVGVPKEVKDQFVSIIPASDDSSFVTGIELFVDGGTAQI